MVKLSSSANAHLTLVFSGASVVVVSDLRAQYSRISDLSYDVSFEEVSISGAAREPVLCLFWQSEADSGYEHYLSSATLVLHFAEALRVGKRLNEEAVIQTSSAI